MTEDSLKDALKDLNEKRDKCLNKEDFCDDAIQPDCKCPYDEKDCEHVCRNQHK